MQSIGFILSTAVALALGASAATIQTRNDPHIVDFRTYGLPGCFEQNQGVYTYTQSQLNQCYQFSTVNIVESLFVLDINDGCSGKSTTQPSCCPSTIVAKY